MRVGGQRCPGAVVSEAEAPGRCPAGLLWSQTDQDLNSSPTTGEQFLHLWEPQFAPVLTDSDGSRTLPAQGLVHMEFIPGCGESSRVPSQGGAACLRGNARSPEGCSGHELPGHPVEEWGAARGPGSHHQS